MQVGGGGQQPMALVCSRILPVTLVTRALQQCSSRQCRAGWGRCKTVTKACRQLNTSRGMAVNKCYMFTNPQSNPTTQPPTQPITATSPDHSHWLPAQGLEFLHQPHIIVLRIRRRTRGCKARSKQGLGGGAPHHQPCIIMHQGQ